MIFLSSKWVEQLRAKCSGNAALSKVARNLGWLLAGKGVGAVLSIVYLGLATRLLGTGGFGQFALILGLAQTITGIVSFQTWQLVVLYGHAAEAKSASLSADPGNSPTSNEVADIINFSLKLDIIAALAGCVLAIITVGIFSRVMGWSPDLSRTALIFALVMLLSVRSTAIGVLRMYDKFGHGAAADAVTPIIRMAGATGAMLFAPNVTGFLVAWAAAEVASASAYWWAVRMHTPARINIFRGPSMADMISRHRGILRFALLTNAGSTLAAINQNMPLLAIGTFVGPVLAGLYRLSNQLAQAFMRLADMLNRAIYPELAKAHSSEGSDSAGELTRRTTLLALLGAGTMVALVVLFGSQLIFLVAGKAFVGAYPVLVLLGISAAVELAGVAFEPMLTASNRTGRILFIRIASAFILAAGLAILLPRFGVMGAAWAVLLTSVVSVALFGTSLIGSSKKARTA